MTTTSSIGPPLHHVRVLMQPGWQNSGPDHWQSHWEHALGSRARRVAQHDWDTPECRDWVDTLARTVDEEPQPAVILAHSVGCLTVAHLLSDPPRKASNHAIAAAVLVAPADVEREDTSAALLSFAPIPMQPLDVPVLVIAGTNDPYCSEARAHIFAQAWRADLELVQSGGHINTDAGFGPWPDGWIKVQEWLKHHALTWEGDYGA